MQVSRNQSKNYVKKVQYAFSDNDNIPPKKRYKKIKLILDYILEDLSY